VHELSITQQVLELAVNKTAEVGAKAVKRINLVIGDMSGIADDCMQFYFDILSQEGMPEG